MLPICSSQVALTIEAGRRCESGPGTFSFETQQAGKIFSLIQSTIKLKTSPVNQNQEGDKVATSIQAHSPLPKLPDMTSMAAILENKLRTQERRDEGAHAREDLVGASECVSAQPAPITLMPLPLVPARDRSSASPHRDQSEAIYANPTDCIQPSVKAQPVRSMYVDPASILPLKPPGSTTTTAAPHPASQPDDLDSVYSEVYDRIRPRQNKQSVLQNNDVMKRSANGEAIYAEPSREKEPQRSDTKPDPFAHLYAQVCKKAPSPNPSSYNDSTTFPSSSSSSTVATTNTANATDASLDDVIYENLGII